jgi:DNA polymerase-3 subunit alpha
VNGRHPTFDLEGITPDDDAVFGMIARGDTAGVFWFHEDERFSTLAQRLATSCFEDLMLVHSLLRPGPLAHGLDDAVIGRKHGRCSRSTIHPVLDGILANTYGVLVYQEQVIQIAHDLAGFSFTQGDLLRRALGRRRPGEIPDVRARFVAGAVERGVGDAHAVAIFEHLLDLTGFGFNRSHAAAYSWLAYQTAYLKHYFPPEFTAALEGLQHNHAEPHP